MRQMLLSFVLIVPIASVAWAQPPPSPRPLPDTGAIDPPQLPPQEQVPDLQLLPPPGLGEVPPKGPPEGRGAQPPQNQAARPNRPPPKPPDTEDQLRAKLAKAPDHRGA